MKSTTISGGQLNAYTLIEFRAGATTNVGQLFHGGEQSFGVYPFDVGGAGQVDAFIAVADNVDGPLNKISWNSFYIINAFTIVDTASAINVDYGLVAYSHADQMDGSKVPTILRIKG